MTITPTQLESTSTLGNHKLQDYSKNVGDDQDASCSPYKPSPEMTTGCNSRTRTNCGALLYDASPTHPQPASLPPSYPESPLSGETPLLLTSSTAVTSWKDNTAIPKESTSPADTSVNGVWGPGEEGGEGEPPKAASNQPVTIEVLGEGGPPDPGPCGGTSGPSGPLDPGDLPDPNRIAERRNLITKSS